MEIAILTFERITALDAVGPYEVLSKLPDARVRWVGKERGQVVADGGLRMGVDATLDEVRSPDIVLVPGGYGTRRLLDDEPVLDWLRHVHEGARFTTSVCTGSIVLASAGLLKGLEATTHWARYDWLEARGARPTSRRVVEQGKIITSAGVSSGIDMALVLAAKLVGEDRARAIQLAIEYDPQPPFDAGSPDKAPAGLADRIRARMDAYEDPDDAQA